MYFCGLLRISDLYTEIFYNGIWKTQFAKLCRLEQTRDKFLHGKKPNPDCYHEKSKVTTTTHLNKKWLSYVTDTEKSFDVYYCQLIMMDSYKQVRRYILH